MDLRDEHDAFQAIINGLKIASDGAAAMSRFRPDTRDAWLKLAEVFKVTEHSAFKLAEERASRVIIKN